MLKPALARGEIQCIGATTLDEYRKYIEKDAALERRFQPIIVEPPTKDETIEILKGLRDRYEAHHRVQITDEALDQAVELSNRYITGRCLPDKAIDVIDEAGARVRLKSMTKPPNLAEIESEIERLQHREGRGRQERRLRACGRRCATRPRQLRKRRRRCSKTMARAGQGRVDGVVDEEVIAEVVSKMTGVPLTRLEKDEAERLLELEDELHKRVISQDEAITAVAKAVRRSRSGLKDPNRPMGSFIFIGPIGRRQDPAGQGLAEFMFGDEDALIQLDMSEYMEKHNVSRLIGAPPGYVGYEEGGQLTERIRRRPYAVRAARRNREGPPGRVQHAAADHGRRPPDRLASAGTSTSRTSILIMTSNIGADLIKNQVGLRLRQARRATSATRR